MKGKIKKIKDSSGVYAFPVTVPDAVFINSEENLTKKLKELETNMNTYIIELERWGITPGLPSKPYVGQDFITAGKNVEGINRALVYASSKNYKEIKLPTNEYAVTYPKVIKMQSNMTFNLNKSKLKVIFDSDSQSPLDTEDRSVSLNYYEYGGITIEMYNISHAEITNGIIEGCKYDRSFLKSNEALYEHSYGISVGESSSYCKISHCDVSGYMGDNINFQSSSKLVTGVSTGTLANLDASTGLQLASKNTIITNFITIPDGIDRWTMQGQGYLRSTLLNQKTYDVFYYDSNDVYLGCLPSKKIHTRIEIPPNAKKMRLKFYEETDETKNFELFINWGGIPEHNTVEYCEVHYGHRGGMTPGGSYTTIQHCHFRDNGYLDSQKFMYQGKPSFPDSTRYHINQEDSFGDNTVIRNNYFSGGTWSFNWSTFYFYFRESFLQFRWLGYKNIRNELR